MANQRMEREGEDQESLFINSSTSPCITATALYYVQSPSTASHANSINHHSSESTVLLSPLTFPHHDENANRIALSRYSSSRGSNNSFEKSKISHESILKSGKLRIVDRIGEDHDINDDVKGRSGVWRYIALDPSASCFCVVFQILWRLMVSIGVALLVFFLVTKPPSPKISVKVVGFKQFSLVEGLDNTGVITKILSINCSVHMIIDNNSKFFRLHIHPPTLEMAFGRLKLAQTQGPESYVESKSSYVLELHVATKDRPVYGAGRSMQDMLESGEGLPLITRVRSRSSYRVVWSLIRLKYTHHEDCILVLTRAYDEKHHIHIQNSTCTASTYT